MSGVDKSFSHMTLTPLINASPAIQIHVCAIIAAVVLTVAQLVGRKGALAHRILGYAWAAAMIAAAISSFFIHTINIIGPFSPIHLLSIFTLVMVPIGIYYARQHKVQEHKITMLNLVIFAIGGAGAFALFMPGRLMFKVLFGG